MLAFYLAAPEIENDRRALNVTYGVKKTRKEGDGWEKLHWGYANKITEDGKKYIAPREPGAGILKETSADNMIESWANEQIPANHRYTWFTINLNDGLSEVKRTISQL